MVFFITISPRVRHYSIRTSTNPKSWKLIGAEKLIPAGAEEITTSLTSEYQIPVSDTRYVIVIFRAEY
jgi:hypothetical protein